MGQITVFSGPERRRRWSDDRKRQILEEAFLAGACVSRVARRHDVSTALIYAWRQAVRASYRAGHCGGGGCGGNLSLIWWMRSWSSVSGWV